MSYNMLWATAYMFASNRGMTLARTAQFAADYAVTFEGAGADTTMSPDAFETISGTIDYHYHG